MRAAISVFLITLGIGQLISAGWGLWGASLTGRRRGVGHLLGLALLAGGGLMLPQTVWVLIWTPVAGILALLLLLGGGSYIWPVPHPGELFAPQHPAHGGCRAVRIPDGEYLMPGLLLSPADGGRAERKTAVCVVPGAGDTKISFKWRLVRSLLAEGFTVLTIDPPGHGEYRYRPLSYPDCLSAILAASEFLRAQPEISRVGMVGFSLGGAMAIRALAGQAKASTPSVDALVVIATPTHLTYNWVLFYRAVWNTFYRSPVLSLLREITAKQIREGWRGLGYRGRQTANEMFELLKPLENIRYLNRLPILLVYSQRDSVAPPEQAQAMRQAVPHADFIESNKASHTMLTLIPEIDDQIAKWLKEQLDSS